MTEKTDKAYEIQEELSFENLPKGYNTDAKGPTGFVLVNEPYTPTNGVAVGESYNPQDAEIQKQSPFLRQTGKTKTDAQYARCIQDAAKFGAESNATDTLDEVVKTTPSQSRADAQNTPTQSGVYRLLKGVALRMTLGYFALVGSLHAGEKIYGSANTHDEAPSKDEKDPKPAGRLEGSFQVPELAGRLIAPLYASEGGTGPDDFPKPDDNPEQRAYDDSFGDGVGQEAYNNAFANAERAASNSGNDTELANGAESGNGTGSKAPGLERLASLLRLRLGTLERQYDLQPDSTAD